MKVFLSWSGARSRSFAKALRDWLPFVVQGAEPWMSDVDIDAGADWRGQIAAHLEACDFGILCVTTENQDSPWLMFEAGALAKKVGEARVCPFLLDMKPPDLKQPLAAFQALETSLDGTKRLVNTISKSVAGGSRVNLDKLVDRLWDDLDDELNRVRIEPMPRSERSLHDKLDDLVGVVRELSNLIRTSPIVQSHVGRSGTTEMSVEIDVDAHPSNEQGTSDHSASRSSDQSDADAYGNIVACDNCQLSFDAPVGATGLTCPICRGPLLRRPQASSQQAPEAKRPAPAPAAQKQNPEISRTLRTTAIGRDPK
jgi:TIR domain-containing protein